MNVQQIATCLMQDEVVAYPTEAVFGLGCNPLSESAVRKLLNLKQRPIEKGLILVAPSLHFLQPFVDFPHLSDEQLSRLQAQYDHPITWVVPAKTEVPHFLTGQFNSIAVRLCTHPAVKDCAKNRLCPHLDQRELNWFITLPQRRCCAFPNLGQISLCLMKLSAKHKNPSEIRDLLTNQLFRQG